VAQPEGGRLLIFLGSARLESEGIGAGDLRGHLEHDRWLRRLVMTQEEDRESGDGATATLAIPIAATFT
jgi:hypothetical protein